MFSVAGVSLCKAQSCRNLCRTSRAGHCRLSHYCQQQPGWCGIQETANYSQIMLHQPAFKTISLFKPSNQKGAQKIVLGCYQGWGRTLQGKLSKRYQLKDKTFSVSKKMGRYRRQATSLAKVDITINNISINHLWYYKIECHIACHHVICNLRFIFIGCSTHFLIYRVFNDICHVWIFALKDRCKF